MTATLTLDTPVATDESLCVHCGQPTATGRRFCCSGCAAAFETIQELGLGRYYKQRLLDPARRAPRPDLESSSDVTRYIVTNDNGTHTLSLAVDGLQCGACVWLIESVLAREPCVTIGRVNMTSRQLRLTWSGAKEDAGRLVRLIEHLGYRLVPFDPRTLSATQDRTDRRLLRALAVAGFAAGNVMLISIGLWAGEAAGWLTDMGPATRDLLHWFSALIALPAIAYAGMPFFTSAATALRRFRTNMDVPISIGVILVTSMSLEETIGHGPYTYYDSAITLLFFLLIGRFLDHRARGQARATVEQLLTLRSTDVAVLNLDGTITHRAQQSIAVGEHVLVCIGERVGIDGVVKRGTSSIDMSLVTGESLPVTVVPGSTVFAGTLNLDQPLTVLATATGDSTFLADCVRLIEAAEARRSHFVVLADRVSRRYAPAVHVTAGLTFLWWYVAQGATLGNSLLTASAVLIITCPCAVALAVPAVQVIASSRLFRAGILLKSATALERLAEVDTVVFDKTGTLTKPSLALVAEDVEPTALREAATLAVNSHHPLARSLLAAAGPVPAAENVTEHPGQGLSAGAVRLGSRQFCGCDGADAATGPELWFVRPHQNAIRFTFSEQPRPNAIQTLSRIRALGLVVKLISGDHSDSVARIGNALGIADQRAGCSPLEKTKAIEDLTRQGHHVLMVGDGLNDSPSLASAHVSASPSTAADISQTVADVVFQGIKLEPVATVIEIARRARTIMRQNLALSIGYNAIMVPLAVAGWVTPWLAAAAMSSSSVLVMANSFRLHGKRTP